MAPPWRGNGYHVEAGMDLRVEYHNPIYLVCPITDAGADWLQKTAPADAQFVNGAMVVTATYVKIVVERAMRDGLSLIIEQGPADEEPPKPS